MKSINCFKRHKTFGISFRSEYPKNLTEKSLLKLMSNIGETALIPSLRSGPKLIHQFVSRAQEKRGNPLKSRLFYKPLKPLNGFNSMTKDLNRK